MNFTRIVRSPGTGELLAAISIFVVIYGALLLAAPFERNLYSFSNYVVLLMPLAVAVIGTSTVLITGGFDLSVAGTIGLSNVLFTILTARYPDQLLMVTIGVLLVGLTIGVINGVLVAVVRLQSIAVTLASYVIMTGVSLLLLPAPGGQVPLSFTSALKVNIGGFPGAVLVLIALGLVWSWLRRTTTGFTLFAIGADRPAAIISGMPVRRTEIGAYAFAGVMYAVSGMYLTAVTASGDPNAGFPFLLTSFAAVAFGLVGFSGGKGTAIGALFGAGSLIALPKLLFALGVQDFWSGVVQGVTILAALSLPLVARRFPRRAAQRSAARSTEPINVA